MNAQDLIALADKLDDVETIGRRDFAILRLGTEALRACAADREDAERMAYIEKYYLPHLNLMVESGDTVSSCKREEIKLCAGSWAELLAIIDAAREGETT